MEKLNKRMRNAQYVSEHVHLLKCPICSSSMQVLESQSLICSNKHTFDFTKQGYVNLTNQHIKTKYTKELFEARRQLMTESRFFEPVVQFISKIICNNTTIDGEPISVLDMGCGDGTHLAEIGGAVQKNSRKVVGVGIDISKEAIFVAAKNNAEKIWVVADLANPPFNDEKFNCILNILSPSNYAEFHRLLKAGGLVIKVVPQSGYLKEIREYIFNEPEKQSYSNNEIVELFSKNFEVVEHSRLQYKKTLDHSSIQSLVTMTPLTWTAPRKIVQSLLRVNSLEVTVDVDILVGKKEK